MIENRLWHPVAAEADLGDAPLAVTLLGEDLVLWRDEEGGVQAFADRCPHRGARLSLGKVVRVDGEARLECPYHGWQFGAGGGCRRIPAVPAFSPPASHAATRHAVVAAHGLLWVRPEAEGEGLPVAPPAFEAEPDARLRKLLCGPYDVETSAPRIVENFLDMAHFSFVHEDWLGERGHAELPAYQVATGADGLRVTNCQAWQPQSNRLSTAGSWVAYDYAVPHPFMAVLSKAPERQAGYRESIALFVCPQQPERSRVWFRLAVPDFASSDAELRAFQHTIFAQDRPVLESQRPKRLPVGRDAPATEVHSAADRSSAAYRRWLRELDVSFGVC
ncbi:aromatic ring-hydroxylating oxygenase subunit alpha [Caldimonas tepidiphila]|uniref:aromatic ring-hydroxylating oxygenase subunit alpha n=1 Tax=Caldimonas tepidiphila TaxID=2315841 RepID=UPI000E5A421D|nr:aromatic ring-hydroxylating dioxygenase subunit alpha [Caldimonas tepidiphila]